MRYQPVGGEKPQPTGVMTGESTPYCLAGYIRFKSESDMALTTLVQKRDAQLFGGASS